MARCWQLMAVAWVLVVVPCMVVIMAIIMAGRTSFSVLAFGLALYLTATLIWIVHKFRQGNPDREQSEVSAPEEELSSVTTMKTPSCVLTIPGLAAVPSNDDQTPPPYDLVQTLPHSPNGEALVSDSCQQVCGGTCPSDCARCGTQAAAPDESELPTYSELVASGAIITSSVSVMAEGHEKCFSDRSLAFESLRVSTVDQFT